MKKFVISFSLIVVAIFLLASCSGENFDKSQSGHEAKISYMAYARVEPDKSLPGICLNPGDTVTLTGVSYKGDCPFTTCECGGPREWVQIAIDSEVRWILKNAIE